MESKLYRAAINGDTSILPETNIISDTTKSYFSSRSPAENNIIHIAVQHGHLDFILAALKLFPDLVHEKNNHGDTPLHVVFELGNKETVSLLISHLDTIGSGSTTAYYMVENKQGDTPFHVALRNSNMEAAVELFNSVVQSHQEILRVVNQSQETPLHLLVRYCAGHLYVQSKQVLDGVLNEEGVSCLQGGDDFDSFHKMYKLVLQSYNVAVCQRDIEGLTPLLRASKNSQFMLVKDLIVNCPESAEICDPEGRTVLHLMKCSPSVYGELKELMAFPEINVLKNRRDSKGNTPAHHAALDGDFVKIKILSESLSDFTLANRMGASVEHLIHRQSNYSHKMAAETQRIVRYMDEFLYNAAVHGKYEWYRLKNDMDISSRTPQGSTILHIAVQRDHVEFAKAALNQHPTLILKRDLSGDTPLHIAARLDNSVAKLLVGSCKDYVKKANEHLGRQIQVMKPWETKNSVGYTPLHEALQMGNFDFALDLIKHTNYDLKSDRSDGDETYLHILARNATNLVYKGESIRKLVELEPSLLMLRDSDGLTPVMRAAQRGGLLFVYLALQTRKQVVEAHDPRGRIFLHHLRLKIVDLSAGERDSIVSMCKRIVSAITSFRVRCIQDHEGNTPLHLAILDGDFDIAQLFLECYIESSPDPSTTRKELSIRNNEGKSVIHLITSTTDTPAYLKELLEQALKGRIMDEKLLEASMKGDVTVFQSLGANDEDEYFLRQAHDGSNIIHIAIRHGHTSFIQTAVERFPSLLFQKDSNGDTAYHIAARLQTTAAFTFLEWSSQHWFDTMEETSLDFHRFPWTVKNSKGNNMLHELARNNNHYELISSAKKHADDYNTALLESLWICISDANNNGETFLHLFARYGTYAASDKLEKIMFIDGSILKSSAPYKRDVDGLTPVLRAATSGRIRLVLLLLKYYPRSLDVSDYKGRTVLHHLFPKAVDLVDDSEDPWQLCKDIFEYPGVDDLRTAQDDDGNTPLHYAILTANVPAAKFLMEICLQSEQKKELTLVNHDGYSVFDLLSSPTRTPDMKELQDTSTLSKRHIKERASIDKMMDDVVYKAATEGDAKIFYEGGDNYEDGDFLTQTPDGSNVLHLVLKHGKKEAQDFVDKALTRLPELIFQPDLDGDTPLHLAAKLHTPASMRLLECAKLGYEKAQEENRRGAYIAPWKVKNSKGNMPIHEALQSNDLEAAEFLIDADPEGPAQLNALGETPLHVFARYVLYSTDKKKENIIELLITKCSTAPFMRDAEGLTPLLRAAKSGRFRVVLAILERCPQSAHLRDPNGRTFLHFLRFTGGEVTEFTPDSEFKKMGKELFEIPEADAQRLVQDNDGNTPLHYAIKNENSIAAELLTQRCLKLERQFELQLANNAGETILDLLASHDAPDKIFELIRKKVSRAMYSAGSSYGIRKSEIKATANSLSVVAGLLATMTFAAAVQVPGGFNSNGRPFLIKKLAFKIFIVSDTVAMCGSMMVIFSLLWAMDSSKTQNPFVPLDLAMTLLQASFYATLVAFMTGLNAAIATHTLWLTIWVFTLCSFVFVLTWRTSTVFLGTKIRLLVYWFFDTRSMAFKLRFGRLKEVLKFV